MTTLATDDFLRADAATLGANWNVLKGMNDLGIFSNQVDCGAAGQCGDGYNGGITWPANQWAQAKFVILGSASTQILLRSETASGTQRNCYMGGTDNNDRGSNNTLIQKYVNDTLTQLADSGAVDISAGQTVYFEIQGTTMIVKVNGVQKLSITDGSFSSGKPGLEGEHAVNTALFDDFAAGDFASTLVPPKSPSFLALAPRVRLLQPFPSPKRTYATPAASAATTASPYYLQYYIKIVVDT